MAKRRANGQMSDSELELRKFHRQVKRVKKYCDDQDIELHDWFNAQNDEQCVLSKDEYELGAYKEYLTNENEPYFVPEDRFQEVSQEALYL